MLFFENPQTALKYTRLTECQRQYVRWIARFQAEHGYPPTPRDMARGTGGSSPNRGQRIINILVACGLARVEFGQSRTLTLPGIRWLTDAPNLEFVP